MCLTKGRPGMDCSEKTEGAAFNNELSAAIASFRQSVHRYCDIIDFVTNDECRAPLGYLLLWQTSAYLCCCINAFMASCPKEVAEAGYQIINRAFNKINEKEKEKPKSPSDDDPVEIITSCVDAHNPLESEALKYLYSVLTRICSDENPEESQKTPIASVSLPFSKEDLTDTTRQLEEQALGILLAHAFFLSKAIFFSEDTSINTKDRLAIWEICSFIGRRLGMIPVIMPPTESGRAAIVRTAAYLGVVIAKTQRKIYHHTQQKKRKTNRKSSRTKSSTKENTNTRTNQDDIWDNKELGEY